MKKLVLLLAVVFSVSLFSCGNADKNAAATDSAVDTTVVADSDSVVAPADSTVKDSTANADKAEAPADKAAEAPAK